MGGMRTEDGVGLKEITPRSIPVILGNDQLWDPSDYGKCQVWLTPNRRSQDQEWMCINTYTKCM